MSSSFPSYDLFGSKITPMTTDDLLELLSSHIRTGEQCVVASQNMHGMHVRLWDAASRQLHSARNTYVQIDGMPIVALCRLCGIDASPKHRVGITHFIWPLLSRAAEVGWRVFYVGSTDEVMVAAVAEIQMRLPYLKLQAHNGYFRDADDQAGVAREIAALDPQLVLVGMGMGVQERWILRHLSTLSPACVLTVGACMEYVAGVVNVAPRWMSRTGCEWIFRLTENPARFWYRYIVEPWFVLAYLIWYSSLPASARLAGRIEEPQHLTTEGRELRLRETA